MMTPVSRLTPHRAPVRRRTPATSGIVAGILSIGLVTFALPPPAGASSVGCTSAAGAQPLALGSVTPDGMLTMENGEVLHLGWIEAPDLVASARAIALERLLGETRQGAEDGPQIHAVGGGFRDRWGRLAALLSVGAADNCLDLQEWLLARGLARLRPDATPGPAPTQLQAWRIAERAAERAKSGLWSDVAFASLSASRPADILRHEGRYVIVEGVPASINELAGQTYLNFGSVWSEDMTVSASTRIWRILTGSGMTAAALKSGVIRVRGIVESRGGPLIELASPADLEVAETGSRP